MHQDHRTSHEEMNLVEFPIGLIADRPPTDPETGKELKTFEWERFISLPSGEPVRQQWKVTGSDAYGLPRGFDFCVLFLLIQIWSEQGFEEKHVEVGSIYRMLKRMQVPDTLQYYQRVRDALDRLIGTTYYTRYAIWDFKKKTYISRFNFNLLDHIAFDNEEVVEDLGACAPSGTVQFTDALAFLVRRGYFKPTDAERYWRIPTPYGRRLFQFLDKRRINGKVQRFEVFSFAKKLGTHDRTLRDYKPAHIKRRLEPHLSYLATDEEQYLERFGWPKEGRRTYLEVCYTGEFGKARQLTDRARALIDEIVDTFELVPGIRTVG